MNRELLKSKIHRATVTGADLHYEGSVAIDSKLLVAADILPYERVDIYDITNGARLSTYAIEAPPGSGTVMINGAAANLVDTGDLVIIASFASYSEEESRRHTPRIILVNQENRPSVPAALDA